VNWKTGTIVYTSLGSGDLDLWTMRSDGRTRCRSRHRQVTMAALLSRAILGAEACLAGQSSKTPETMTVIRNWLADNLTAPMKMELMVADADGKNARQITDYGCASFAPSFTPDGRGRLFFRRMKNECDSRHFELFMITLDGTGLEQVTSFGDLPRSRVFSGWEDAGVLLRSGG